MNHLLLQNSFRYKRRTAITQPAGFIYNKRLGAWIDESNNCLFVLNSQFSSVATKKEDIETGEDHKGH